MSVCIAAIGKHDAKESRILAMTDRKVSSVEFSNEDASVKGKIIDVTWLAMFAGNDVSPCIPIARAVQRQLNKNRIKDGNTVEAVSRAFEDRYQD